MAINVFVENFTSSNATRANEIATCISKNKDNQHINYTILNSESRLTYQNIFDIINIKTDSNDINVVANLDIVFDDSILLLNKLEYMQFAALSRYEMRSDGTYYIDELKAKYTQDVWAWKGKISLINIDFPLGVYGCDNRLAYEALQAGYNVINPSYSVYVYHYHMSNIRADDYYLNKIEGPQYFVFPSMY